MTNLYRILRWLSTYSNVNHFFSCHPCTINSRFCMRKKYTIKTWINICNTYVKIQMYDNLIVKGLWDYIIIQDIY